MTLQFGPCREGDLILTSKPFAHAVSETYRLILCNQCFKRCENLLRCSACTVVRYCSRRCQKGDWKSHKQECSFLKKYSPKVPTESVRLYLRLILKHQSGETSSCVGNSLGQTRCFNDLMSHAEEIRQDETRTKLFISMCEGLKHHLGLDIEQFSPEVLLDLFGRMTVNSFSICDMEMQPIGVGVYLIPSKLDHSCDPNAVITFRGAELYVRSTQRLSQRTEIKISYIDQLNSSVDRQQQLKEQYYFTCKCLRCQDNKQEKKMVSSSCPTENCDGHIIQEQGQDDLHCDSCNRKDFTVNYKDRRQQAAETVIEVLNKLKELKKLNDDGQMIEVCQAFNKSWHGVLHPSNIHVTHLMDHAFDASINLNQWDDALKFGQSTIKPYKLYYPEFHPTLGIQLMKIGKIQLHLMNDEEAFRYLRQAEDILSITHGTDSQLFTDLKELLFQCQSSIAAITQ